MHHHQLADLTGGERLLAVSILHPCKLLSFYDFTKVFPHLKLELFNRISASCRALELQFNTNYIFRMLPEA